MLIGEWSRDAATASTGFPALPFVGSLFCRYAVIALQPAAKVDLRATRRAEWPVLRHRRLAADRTGAGGGSLDRRDGGHCQADIVTARRFETAHGRSRDRRRSRDCGRIAPWPAALRAPRVPPAPPRHPARR